MSLASSWDDASSLLLSSRAPKQVATRSGRPGREHWTRCASLDKLLFPALPWGRGCPSLTSCARHWVFPAPLSTRCFHFLWSQSAESILALPSRGSPGWKRPSRGHCHPRLQPWAPGGHLRASSTSWSSGPWKEPWCGRGTGRKALACCSTQVVSVFPQHFVSCSKKPHCFSIVVWMYSRWKHWKECFDCKLVCWFFFLSPPSRNMSLLSKKIPPWKEKLES